jgi:carbon catabolite-derepressing protein kinase
MEPAQFYGTVDGYTLIQEIGFGVTARVFKAEKEGKMFALKLINETKKTRIETNKKALLQEAKVLQSIQHPNIIKLKDFGENATLIKKDGTEEQVVYVVLELAEGGEMLDYMDKGGFSDDICRYFFRQLVDALESCHNKHFCHRDIKTENLLLDKDFNLLLVDFGFTIPQGGKDGNGLLTTILGTEYCMAPEVLKGNYNGTKVDIFALGVTLFFMRTAKTPFTVAKVTDSYFKLIIDDKLDKFWSYHYRGRAAGINYFGQDFISLVNQMLSIDPSKRPTIQQIKAHPWYKKQAASPADIAEHFTAMRPFVEQRVAFRNQQSSKNSSFC